MKCPNIYCIARNFDRECDQGDDYFEQCELRKSYEQENCPTEEEYKRTEQEKRPLCHSCNKLTECIINGDISTGDGVFECGEYKPLF